MIAYLGSIIGFAWLIFIIYWFISAMSAKRTIRGGTWWRWALVRVVVIVAAVILLGGDKRGLAQTIVTRSTALEILGAVLTVLGIALAIWARIYLGRNWGMPMSVKESPELITSGPYATVRHPIYSGILLALLGSTLVLGYLWLILFVFMLVYFSYSAKTEEKRMQELFPDTYPPYKKRTKMLIPFIL